MKRKVINAAVCDARNVTEESLAGFGSIHINTGVLIVGKRSGELLNRYPVSMNAAKILELPDGQDIPVKTVNGKGEIGPDEDGTGAVLMVNGKLTVLNGSRDAVGSYYLIVVNGKALMPESCRGLPQMQVNGKTEYYPDGAVILKVGTQIDGLFVARAANPLYYCPGSLYFLDTAVGAEKLKEKGIAFAARRIVIAQGLVDGLVPAFDERAEIVRVPDGARLIDGDVDLKRKTIDKYGAKLCVTGDVSIRDAEALSSLKFLLADGKVSVNRELEDAFGEVESVVEELKIVDPDMGYITDRSKVTVGPALIGRYPNGVRIEDCAKVTISEELTSADIMDRLRIADCALVVCTKEQEEAVDLIAEDVARIRTSGQEKGEDPESGEEDPEDKEDVLTVNAAEYKM